MLHQIISLTLSAPHSDLVAFQMDRDALSLQFLAHNTKELNHNVTTS